MSAEDVKAKTAANLNSLTEDDLQNCFEHRQHRMQLCVISEGNYFEGNRGEKGSRPGRAGTTVLSRGVIDGLPEGSSFSSGVIDKEYSLPSPKTVCAWRTAVS